MGKKDTIARELENTLLRFHGKLTSKELRKYSGVKDKTKFRKVLGEMERDGEVTVSRDHVVELIRNENRKTAVIVSLSKGFAFARMTEGDEPDLFIHSSGLNGALLGDKVEVLPVMDDPKGPSGRVLKILERKEQRTTGTVVREGFYFALRADCAIRYDISIMDRDLLGANEGDKVMAELYTRPGGDRLFARVIKIYGKGSSARVCADAILEQNDIPAVFPEDVLKEAEAVSSRGVTDEDRKGRLDLRRFAIFTIEVGS